MTFTIDDNLRDVLEDITTSKKSALFAGTYLKNIHEAYTIPEGRFAAMRLGMGSAERHLLETYRSELSMVLLQGFYKNFFEVEEFASKVHNLGEIPAAEPLEERARFARDSAPRDAFVGKTTHWLRRLLEGRPIAKAEDLESMLTAAIGLRDRPEARVYMGWARYALGDWVGVTRVVQPLLRADVDPGARLCEALSLVSNAQYYAGNSRASINLSVAAVKQAWRVADLREASAEFANLVAQAALVGEFGILGSLASQLEGLAAMDLPRVSQFLSFRLREAKVESKKSTEVVQRVSESLKVQVILESEVVDEF